MEFASVLFPLQRLVGEGDARVNLDRFETPPREACPWHEIICMLQTRRNVAGEERGGVHASDTSIKETKNEETKKRPAHNKSRGSRSFGCGPGGADVTHVRGTLRVVERRDRALGCDVALQM